MKNVKRLLHITLGFILVFVGIAGLVLPVLNGTILLLLGLILLSFESSFVQSHLEKVAHKYRFIGALYDKLDFWMKKIFK